MLFRESCHFGISNDLEGHLLVAGLFQCNLTICVHFAWFQLTPHITQSLGNSWASCLSRNSLTQSRFPMNQTPLKSVLPFILGMWAKFGSHKKRKITMWQWYFADLPRRLHWGDWFKFWPAGWCLQHNHPRQILCRSVQHRQLFPSS